MGRRTGRKGSFYNCFDHIKVLRVYFLIGRNLAADAYKDAEGSDTGDNTEPKILLIPVWDCL